ncbi:MAG: superoxide dismutase family protein [Balneolaceae bacterium]
MRLINYLTVLLFVIAGCTNGQRMDDSDRFSTEAFDDDRSKAIATLHSLGDQDISGSVTFEETDDGVSVQGSFEGLEDGEHGFHVHQFGDCSASDGSSAGGHFAPDDNEHGAPDDDNRHMGDMGNLSATSGQAATINYVDEVIDIRQIIGRAVVIHGGQDDLVSQPSGDAGNRIACGVIGIAETDEESTDEAEADTVSSDIQM